MAISFNSDAGFGNGVGWSDGPNTYKNPYAQGGPLFGQGYGDQRHVLQPGVDYPWPQPQPTVDPTNYTVGQGLQQSSPSSSFGSLRLRPSFKYTPPAPGAPQGYSGSSSANPTINTTITPQPVYSPADTQAASNQAIAESQRQANMRWLQKPYDKPGVTRSASSAALAAPQAQEYLSQGALAAQQIPFSDASTNAQNILRGQTGRDAETLGLAEVLSRFNSANTGYNTGQQTSLMNLIASLLGGQMGGGGLSNFNLGSLLGSPDKQPVL